jgi:hypothetical protein
LSSSVGIDFPDQCSRNLTRQRKTMLDPQPKRAAGSHRSILFGIRCWIFCFLGPIRPPPLPNAPSRNSGGLLLMVRSYLDHISFADCSLIESLFSSTSSAERKYWGFQIFQKALPRVNQSSDLPMLFTKNFMRSWINHLSNSDRYLHKVARAVVCQNHLYIGLCLKFI